MEPIYKKCIDQLIAAEKEAYSADHMINVVYPVVKDGKILLRAFESVNKALKGAISAILKYEYLYKRVELSLEAGKNMEAFFKKCANRYGIDEEGREKIKEMLLLGKRHKESGFEFTRPGRVVILDDSGQDLKKSEIQVQDIKGYTLLIKELIGKAKGIFAGKTGG